MAETADARYPAVQPQGRRLAETGNRQMPRPRQEGLNGQVVSTRARGMYAVQRPVRLLHVFRKEPADRQQEHRIFMAQGEPGHSVNR